MAINLQTYNDPSLNPVLYTPDFSFLKYVLDKKNAQYEQGLAAVSSTYNSILNAPLTKDENKASREQYIKEAQSQLQKIAGSDLSLQQNIYSANSVFAPFWQDKDVLADYSFTKQQSSEMQKQAIIQNSSDEDIRNQYSTVPGALMQDRMEKVKSAKKGDLSIYEQPIVKSTPFYDVYKEAAAFVKDNDFKITNTVTPDGRIETYVNGPGTQKTYAEIVRELRSAGKYRAQDYMMGQYQTMNAIKDIQEKSQANGTTISEEQAKQLIPDYYAGSYITSLNTTNGEYGSRIANIDNQIKTLSASTDPAVANQLQDLLNTRKQYKDNIGENDKLIKTWSDKNSDAYKKAVESVAYNPAGFFGNIYSEGQIDAAARLLASNQSKKVESDTGYWKGKELEQAAILAHDSDATKRWIAVLTHSGKGGASQSGDPAGSYRGSNGVLYDIDGNLLDDTKQKGEINSSYDVPTVERAKDAIKVQDKIGAAKTFIFNERNRAISNQFNIFQTEGSAITGKYITSQEAAILKTAVATGKYTAEYKTAINSVAAKLKQSGVIKNESEVTGPMSAMNLISSRIETDMNDAIKVANANPTNGEARANALRQVEVYNTLRSSQAKLNNLSAKEKQFNDEINAVVSKPGYEKVRVKEGNNYTFINSKYLRDTYGLPDAVASQYLAGNYKVESAPIYDTVPVTPNAGNDYQTEKTVITGYKKWFTTPDGQSYDVSKLVNDFGDSKTLNTNLTAAIATAGASVDNGFLKLFSDETGQMGRVVTYGSDATASKRDMGDIIANDVLGPGMKYEIVKDNPIVNYTDGTELEFANKVFNLIKSNPGDGLTGTQLYTISPYDPTKRAVKLMYSAEQIGKLFTEAERKTNAANIAKIAGNGLMVNLREGEEIKGFPTAGNMGYYEMMLKDNVNKSVVKNNEMEESLGVKYDLYRDGTGQVYYKAAVKKVVADPANKDKYIETWVDPRNPDVTEDYSRYTPIPEGADIEAFVKGLQESSANVFINNSKIISSIVTPKPTLKQMYPDLWKQIQDLHLQ